jgi:hypothetical protein
MSIPGAQNRHAGPDLLCKKNLFQECRERRDGSDYSMKTQMNSATKGGRKNDNLDTLPFVRWKLP